MLPLKFADVDCNVIAIELPRKMMETWIIESQVWRHLQTPSLFVCGEWETQKKLRNNLCKKLISFLSIKVKKCSFIFFSWMWQKTNLCYVRAERKKNFSKANCNWVALNFVMHCKSLRKRLIQNFLINFY